MGQTFRLACIILLIAGCDDPKPPPPADGGQMDRLRPQKDHGEAQGDSGATPLEVALTASPHLGPTPLTVTFQATAAHALGEPAFHWDSDDGLPADSGPSWSHTYNSPGEYTATVTATDDSHATASASLTITVGEANALNVTARADPALGLAPLTVTLDATAQGGTRPFLYSWDLGDGTEAQGALVSHEYGERAIYRATVLAVDAMGNGGSAHVDIDATGPAFTVAIEATPLTGYAPLAVTLSAIPTRGTGPYTFAWLIDDTTAQGQEVEVTFEQPGHHPVSLLATDSQGAQSTAEITLEALAPLTVTLSASPLTGPAPLEVRLQGEAQGGQPPHGYRWDLGDGTMDVTPSPIHVYGRPGAYPVALTVTDAAGEQAYATEVILVEGAGSLEVKALAEPSSGTAPLEVVLSAEAQGEGKIAFTWDLGDGEEDRGGVVRHIYGRPGTYIARAKAEDLAGQWGEAWAVIEVTAPEGLAVMASADPPQGQTPLTVTLTALAAGAISEVDFAWDLGDGSQALGQEVDHTYGTPGTYIVVVTATDGGGQEAQDAVEVQVSPLPMVVTAEAQPDAGTAPLMVQFTGTVQGGVLPHTYAWSFGDGTTSDQASPQVVYRQGGIYSVTFTTTDGRGEHASQSLVVRVTSDLAPVIAASASPAQGIAPLGTRFHADVSGGNGPLSVSWDYGDGQGGLGVDSEHTYTVAGQYGVVATVEDEDGDSAEDALVVRVLEDWAVSLEAQAHPTVGLAPLSVAFRADIQDGNPPFNIMWDFGDGQGGSEQNPIHEFTEAGSYVVTLTVRDRDGDEGAVELTIHGGDEHRPVAMAWAEPAEGLAPLDVQLWARAMGGEVEIAYQWDFGDGSRGAGGASPTHMYQAGEYTATLVATDCGGHEAQGKVAIRALDPSLPYLTLTADPAKGHAPLAVHYRALAQGGVGPYTFRWDLGEEGTSQAEAFTMIHEAEGVRRVTCRVKDRQGAEDQADLEVTVLAPQDPLALAEASPLGGQAPLVVQFEGGAMGGQDPLTYFWDLGDGTTSLEQSPFHVYTTDGPHEVTLMVTDRAGKGDQASVTVEVASNQRPVAGALAEPKKGMVPLRVMFRAQAVGGWPPLTFRWNFGDGEMAMGAYQEHIYEAPGRFQAELTVSDAHGARDRVGVLIEVASEEVPLVSALAEPEAGPAPLDVAFGAEILGGREPYEYRWTFGDGVGAEGAEVRHRYEGPGTYLARIDVLDGQGQLATDTVVVVVSPF